MKSGNSRPLSLLVGGTALVAFMFSAVIAQQQKKTAAPPTTAKGTTAGSTAGAIRVNLSPNQFTAVKPAKAVNFVPFTVADLPQTNGKPATATTQFKLPNGKMASATEYLAQMNNCEQKLNALGYSLRSSQKVFKVGALSYDKNAFKQQVVKAQSYTPVSAKAKATTLASVEQKYQADLKAFQAAPKAAAATAEATKGAKGAKGTKGAEGATAEGTTGQKSSKAVAKVPPGAVGIGAIGRALAPFSTTKSWDTGKLGNFSYVGAELSASMTFTGDANSASLSGIAKATGAAVGTSKDLVVATASLNAPKTGNLSANLKVTVLGTDEIVENASEQVSFNKNATYTKSLPDTWKFSMTIPILIVSIDVTLGVKGGLTMPYFLSDVPGESMAYVIPDVQATVYGEAAVGVGGDDGVECGVKGTFSIMHNNLILFGSASQGTDSTGTFVNYSVTSEDRLTALSGDIYAFASLFGAEVDQDIFNFTGITAVFTPIDGGEKVYLKPIQAVNKAQ